MKSNIQEQLRARKLKPSEDSWDILEARLEQDRNKGSKKRVFWYAASIAALFLISLAVFRNTNVEVVPPIQNADVPNEVESPIKEVIQENATNTNELIAMPVEVEKSEEKQRQTAPKEQIAKTVELDTKEIHPETLEHNIASQLTLEQPLVAVTEGVVAMNTIEVSDQELDALLDEAQQTMQLQKRKKQRESDADWLLVEVEMELDHNFKDKVFEAIKNAVKNPKNTITKRDN